MEADRRNRNGYPAVDQSVPAVERDVWRELAEVWTAGLVQEWIA